MKAKVRAAAEKRVFIEIMFTAFMIVIVVIILFSFSFFVPPFLNAVAGNILSICVYTLTFLPCSMVMVANDDDAE